MEKPKTKRFLEELRSTNCRLESPTAVIIPNSVQNRAPRTGSGREANRALNLPTSPSSSIMAAPYWITRLLPTWRGKQYQQNGFYNNCLSILLICIKEKEKKEKNKKRKKKDGEEKERRKTEENIKTSRKQKRKQDQKKTKEKKKNKRERKQRKKTEDRKEKRKQRKRKERKQK